MDVHLKMTRAMKEKKKCHVSFSLSPLVAHLASGFRGRFFSLMHFPEVTSSGAYTFTWMSSSLGLLLFLHLPEPLCQRDHSVQKIQWLTDEVFIVIFWPIFEPNIIKQLQMVKHLENQMCKDCNLYRIGCYVREEPLEQHTAHWYAAAGFRIPEFMVRIVSVGMFSEVKVSQHQTTEAIKRHILQSTLCP